MKKFSLILILFSLLYNFSFANTYSTDPKQFVDELINDAISKLSDKNLNEEQKKNFVEKIAVKNVDINALYFILLAN